MAETPRTPAFPTPAAVGLLWTLLLALMPAVAADAGTGSLSEAGDSAVDQIARVDGGVVAGPDVAVTSAGNPVLAYTTASQVWITRCADPNCLTWNRVLVADTPNPSDVALALTSGDLPMVAFVSERSEVRLARCLDPACGSLQTISVDPVVVDPIAGGDEQREPRLVLTSDDRPILAYTSQNPRLSRPSARLAICNDPACTSIDRRTVDGDMRQTHDVTVGVGDSPIVAFEDQTGELVLRRCTNPLCPDTTAAMVGPSGEAALAIDRSSDNAIVVHRVLGDLHIDYCSATECDPAATKVIDRVDFAERIDVTLNSLGAPVVAWNAVYGDGLGDIRIARCGDPRCLGWQVIDAASGGFRLEHIAIGLTPEDRPAVAFTDFTTDAKVLVCDDQRCAPTPFVTTTARQAVAPQDGTVQVDFVMECVPAAEAQDVTVTVPPSLLIVGAGGNNGVTTVNGQTVTWYPNATGTQAGPCPATAAIATTVAADATPGIVDFDVLITTRDTATDMHTDTVAIRIVRRGDADCNGRVDLLDARRVALVAIEAVVDPDPCPRPNANLFFFAAMADMDGDGTTSLGDARNVALCAIGAGGTGCSP